jgi:hypothetical protein
MELLEHDPETDASAYKRFKLGLLGALGFLLPVLFGLLAAFLSKG